MTTLILTGFRGVGKSTLGRLLAERVKAAFIDTDSEVERMAGKTVADIFSSQGEAYFRQLEEEVISSLSPRIDTIIALGGGAILSEKNRRIIGQLGKIVWLVAPLPIMVARLKAGAPRPRLSDLVLEEEVRTLYDARTPFYRKLADETVDTNRAMDEVLDELEHIWRTF